MLRKTTQDALKEELAILNNRGTEIEFARAIILQALGLAETPATPVTKAAAIPAPVKTAKAALKAKTGRYGDNYKKILTKANILEVKGHVIAFLSRYDGNAADVAKMLNESEYPVTAKSTASLLYRMLKSGEIKKADSATKGNTTYTTKGV